MAAFDRGDPADQRCGQLGGRGVECPQGAIWWFAEGQQQVGPMTLNDLGAEMAAGRVGDRTPAWRKGMRDWAMAGSIGDLAQQGRPRYDGANLGKGAPS